MIAGRWTLADAVAGPLVARATAAGGALAVAPVVAWTFAVGGNAAGAAGALALVAALAGLASCVGGFHHGPPAAGVALAAAVVIALAGSETSGVRLDAGPVAAFLVLGIELWGWSLDHRADLVTGAAVAHRGRALGVVVGAGLLGSLAVTLLAGAGGGDMTVRALAVAMSVAAVALLVRDLRAER